MVDGDTCVRDSGDPGASGVGCAAPAPLALRYQEPPVTTGGDFNLRLGAPGAGNQGSVNYHGDRAGLAAFDWDAGAAGDESPTGQATFGIFGGERRARSTRARSTRSLFLDDGRGRTLLRRRAAFEAPSEPPADQAPHGCDTGTDHHDVRRRNTGCGDGVLPLGDDVVGAAVDRHVDRVLGFVLRFFVERTPQHFPAGAHECVLAGAPHDHDGDEYREQAGAREHEEAAYHDQWHGRQQRRDAETLLAILPVRKTCDRPRGRPARPRVFLALYFVSLSSGLHSISRPGRTNAYSPARLTITTATKTANRLEPARTRKPATMMSGTAVRSAVTPKRAAMRPVKKT